MSKGSTRRPGAGYEANWGAIFKPRSSPEPVTLCDCEPGKCKMPAEKCKDWLKRGGE